jgi:hypothetical protein
MGAGESHINKSNDSSESHLSQNSGDASEKLSLAGNDRALVNSERTSVSDGFTVSDVSAKSPEGLGAAYGEAFKRLPETGIGSQADVNDAISWHAERNPSFPATQYRQALSA